MSQIDLFKAESQSDAMGLHQVANGEYIFKPQFFSKTDSDVLFTKLRSKIEWKQESMILYGKKINFPRLTAWYGETENSYSFSNITLHPLPWIPELLDVKDQLENFSGDRFNSVLLNLYRNGNDSISWHTDAEPELGTNPVIGSVNFGETRRFQLRHRYTGEKIEFNLTHGSLLVMKGEMQHYWQHQVPKTSKSIGERINLTFRLIKPN